MKIFFKALYFIACVFLLKIGNDLFFLTDVNLFWVCLYVFFVIVVFFPLTSLGWRYIHSKKFGKDRK